MAKKKLELKQEEVVMTKVRSMSELEELRVSLTEGLEQAMKTGDISRVKSLREQIEDTKVELEVSKRVEYEQTVAGLAAEVRKYQGELRSAETILLEKAKALGDVLRRKAAREQEFIEAGRRRDAVVSLLKGNLSTYGTAKFPVPPGLIGEESYHAQSRTLTEAAKEFGYQHGSDLEPYGSMTGYRNWSLSEVENLITRLERKAGTIKELERYQ